MKKLKIKTTNPEKFFTIKDVHINKPLDRKYFKYLPGKNYPILQL